MKYLQTINVNDLHGCVHGRVFQKLYYALYEDRIVAYCARVSLLDRVYIQKHDIITSFFLSQPVGILYRVRLFIVLFLLLRNA